MFKPKEKEDFCKKKKDSYHNSQFIKWIITTCIKYNKKNWSSNLVTRLTFKCGEM
jgi:hypothetical protein